MIEHPHPGTARLCNECSHLLPAMRDQGHPYPCKLVGCAMPGTSAPSYPAATDAIPAPSLHPDDHQIGGIGDQAGNRWTTPRILLPADSSAR